MNSNNKRPNLLFVMADQMRGQAMGCMGNEQIHTPNLDRLAEDGMLFSNAISIYPICCPARASILTGRFPLSHGVYANGPALPDSEVTIGEILKAEGYQTAYIGKWHLFGHGGNPGLPYGSIQYVPPGPKRHGFDHWAASNIIHDYFNSYYYTDTDEKIPIVGWEPDTQTDLAIDYLKQYQGDQPFCLFLSWGPPHDPYIAPEQYLKMYPPENIKLRENVFLADRSVIAAYYAAITSLDWNMGRILEELDHQGLTENTIVVFTSDHGAQLFSLYLFHKQWPYEETILVPFIIRYPRVLKGGQVNDVLLSTPDILPTLLRLMDVSIPETVEGKDLSPFLLGTATEPEPDSVLIEVIRTIGVVADRTGLRAWRGVRTKRYTYARFRSEDWLLIDNKYDPYQRRNLIHNPEYRDKRDELNNKLEDWLHRTNDSFIPESEYPHFEMSRNRPPLLPENQ